MRFLHVFVAAALAASVAASPAPAAASAPRGSQAPSPSVVPCSNPSGVCGCVCNENGCSKGPSCCASGTCTCETQSNYPPGYGVCTSGNLNPVQVGPPPH